MVTVQFDSTTKRVLGAVSPQVLTPPPPGVTFVHVNVPHWKDTIDDTFDTLIAKHPTAQVQHG